MKISDNTIQSAVYYFKNELTVHYAVAELEQILYLTFFHYFGLSRIDLIASGKNLLSESDLLKIIYTVKGLKKNKPLAYIFGEWEFYGIPLKVNEQTLIPRPETEELVDLIIKENQGKDLVKVLDIGTGSGCIAISLKKHLLNANVNAWDVSEGALNIAKKNAIKNDFNISFKKVNILEHEIINSTKKFDIIVSNPPYIAEDEKTLMHENVLNYEPHLALFVENNNPLLFYNAIADFALKYLNKKGNLYFEINEKYGKEVVDLLINRNFKNVNIVKDINNKDRIVRCNLE